VVNGMAIFTVDHLYSGYEVPKKEGKPQITMLMQWEGNAKKYKYVIPKPGSMSDDPTTNKKITSSSSIEDAVRCCRGRCCCAPWDSR